ncbi:MAG: hypothetical protein V7606_4932 [Burkholderiales bacterium]
MPRFPKFVIHRSTHRHELRNKGVENLYDGLLGPAFVVLPKRGAADLPYGASTITSSEFPVAVILTAMSLMATPSRASIRTPLISTAPEAGTR